MQYDPGKNRGVLIGVIVKVGKYSQKGHKPLKSNSPSTLF